LPSPETQTQTLVLPPTPQTLNTLSALNRAARQGSSRAAWIRLHYLVDLFDYARFAKDAAARQTLLQALGMWKPRSVDARPPQKKTARGVAPPRGPKLTRTVLAQLSAAVKKLNRKRLDLPAHQQKALHTLRKMLQADLHFPKTHKGLAALADFLHRTSCRGGLMAPNALLRRYGWCMQAFRAAIWAKPARKNRTLCFCLYPLFRSNPKLYFQKGGFQLPHPRWPHFRIRLRHLRAHLKKPRYGGRLASVTSLLAKKERRFFRKYRGLLPPAFDPDDPLLPRTPPGQIRSGGPWVRVDQKGVRADGRRTEALTKRALRPLFTTLYRRAPRRHLTVAAGRNVPWYEMFKVLKPITRTGFESVGVAVASAVSLRASPGSYWHWVARGAPKPRALHCAAALKQKEPSHGVPAQPVDVMRITELPVSLLVLAPWPPPKTRKSTPVAPWEGSCANRWLTVKVDPDYLQLSARGGYCSLPIALHPKPDAPPRSTAVPRRRLQQQLRRLKKAYPTECGLMIAVSGAASWGLVARTLAAARRDAQGMLWPMQAFRLAATPCQKDKSLDRLIQARLSARVVILKTGPARSHHPLGPQKRAALADALLGCYRQALDKNPTLKGRFEISTRPLPPPPSTARESKKRTPDTKKNPPSQHPPPAKKQKPIHARRLGPGSPRRPKDRGLANCLYKKLLAWSKKTGRPSRVVIRLTTREAGSSRNTRPAGATKADPNHRRAH
jgi:hypothetical protein